MPIDIENLIVDYKKDIDTKATVLTHFHVYVESTIEDPFYPGQRITNRTFFPVSLSTNLSEIVSSFVRTDKRFRGIDFYVCYNNRLFDPKQGTVGQCGIKSRSTVYLISPNEEKQVAQNEGFKLSFWALPPLMIAISFMLSGLTGSFDLKLRGLYVLIGSVIGVPSFLCFFIGLTERFSKLTQTAFSGTEWFGECCCQEEEPEALQELTENAPSEV